MQLIKQNSQKRANKQILPIQIATTFKTIGLTLVNHIQEGLNTQVVLLTSKVALPRANHQLDLFWKITLTPANARVKVKLSSQQSQICSQICALLVKNDKQVSELVGQINNFRLKDKQSLFYFDPNQGYIGMKLNIFGIRFISTTSKLLLFLKHKVCQLSNIFIEELENMLFYFKAPGFTFNSLEKQFIEGQKKLQRFYFMINHLRQFFAQRMDRAKKEPTVKQNKINSYVLEHFDLLYGSDYLHPSVSEILTGQGDRKIQFKFNQERTHLFKNFDMYQTEELPRILTGIVVKGKQLDKNQMLLQADQGLSQIRKGIFSFIPQISINKHINTEIACSKSLKTQFLVRKKCKGQKLITLLNQFTFLSQFRDSVCPYFGKYYVNCTKKPFSDRQLFCDWYPDSLEDNTSLLETHKLNIIEDVCMGLLFMNSHDVIHRDIKGRNIMIDRQKRGRIIDFGSVANVFGTDRFKPMDKEVRSTPGYYVPYTMAIDMIPSLGMTQTEFQSHRNYDQVGLGKIINSQLYLDYVSGPRNFLRYNLLYLSWKCMQVNPEDRLNIEQATIFLRQLIQYKQARKQFWKLRLNTSQNRQHEVIN